MSLTQKSGKRGRYAKVSLKDLRDDLLILYSDYQLSVILNNKGINGTYAGSWCVHKTTQIGKSGLRALFQTLQEIHFSHPDKLSGSPSSGRLGDLLLLFRIFGGPDKGVFQESGRTPSGNNRIIFTGTNFRSSVGNSDAFSRFPAKPGKSQAYIQCNEPRKFVFYGHWPHK